MKLDWVYTSIHTNISFSGYGGTKGPQAGKLWLNTAEVTKIQNNALFMLSLIWILVLLGYGKYPKRGGIKGLKRGKVCILGK